MPGFDKEQISKFECYELIEYLSEEHQVDPRILKFIVTYDLCGTEFVDARFCDETEEEMEQVGVTPEAISRLREVHRSVVVGGDDDDSEPSQVAEASNNNNNNNNNNVREEEEKEEQVSAASPSTAVGDFSLPLPSFLQPQQQQQQKVVESSFAYHMQRFEGANQQQQQQQQQQQHDRKETILTNHQHYHHQHHRQHHHHHHYGEEQFQLRLFNDMLDGRPAEHSLRRFDDFHRSQTVAASFQPPSFHHHHQEVGIATPYSFNFSSSPPVSQHLVHYYQQQIMNSLNNNQVNYNYSESIMNSEVAAFQPQVSTSSSGGGGDVSATSAASSSSSSSLPSPSLDGQQPETQQQQQSDLQQDDQHLYSVWQHLELRPSAAEKREKTKLKKKQQADVRLQTNKDGLLIAEALWCSPPNFTLDTEALFIPGTPTFNFLALEGLTNGGDRKHNAIKRLLQAEVITKTANMAGEEGLLLHANLFTSVDPHYSEKDRLAAIMLARRKKKK